MNWAEHLDAEFQLLEKDIIPEMMWLYQKFRVAMRSEHLIRRLTSFVRNSAGQMAGDAYGNSLKGEIMLMKELLRETFADELPPQSLNEWTCRLFEQYDAMFIGLDQLAKKNLGAD